MSATQERRTRRTKEEILALVDRAEKLISSGTPKTQAAEQVGLSYPVLQKHLGEGVKNTGGNKVKDAVERLINTIREDVKREILGKL